MRKMLLVVITTVAAAGANADCDHTAARRVSASMDGVTRIKVVGRAGTLRVTGQTGAREVIATGTACSDDRGTLDDIQLRSRRSGSELRIEAVMAEQSTSFFDGAKQSRLDFQVFVPNNVALDIEDGSGEATIENVGALRVIDGSGSMEIHGVHGDLHVADGSGGLTISDVEGSVDVEDGSGSMEIRNVSRDVIVDDGSGSIDVKDVRGNFIVKDDGSGGIEYDRITGRVDVPRRYRH